MWCICYIWICVLFIFARIPQICWCMFAATKMKRNALTVLFYMVMGINNEHVHSKCASLFPKDANK